MFEGCDLVLNMHEHVSTECHIYFPYNSFGRMVACFRYASINIYAVFLPPAKLEFNYENQEWLQKESKEVTSFPYYKLNICTYSTEPGVLFFLFVMLFIL